MSSEVFGKLTYCLGIYYYRKSSVACSSFFFLCFHPNGHRQWARPSLHMFILKELNAAECEGLAYEIGPELRPRSRFWLSKNCLDNSEFFP